MENDTLKQLNVRVPQQILDDLKALASIAGTTIGNIVVNFLHKSISPYREIIDSRNNILELLNSKNFDFDKCNLQETTKEFTEETCTQTKYTEVEQKLPTCEQQQEIWKTIVGSGGYKISNFGRVQSKTGKILSPTWRKRDAGEGGTISMRIGRKKTTKTIAKEVLRAFKGTPPNGGWKVRYKDGNRKNLKLDNLEWAN